MNSERAAGPRVAVFSPNQGTPSETFIRAHIESLPLPTTAVYGGGWRRFTDRGALWPLARYPGRALALVAPAGARRVYAHALAAKLKTLEADVVLAEYGTTGAEIQDACRVGGQPLVVYFFGFDVWRTALVKRFLPDYRRLFANAAAIVAVSDSIRARLLELGAPVDKVHHIPCGADPQQFHGARPQEAPPHFVAVGRFIEKKSPLSTIRAFSHVAASIPDARLSMVGDGPLLASAKRLSASLGLDERISFLGFREPSAVAALLRTARAFVQHSVTAGDGDREGMPVAVIEAQMAGLPVIATRHSGITEVVADQVSGLLVEEGDVAGMGDALLQLAIHSERAGQLGREARIRAQARFSRVACLRSLAAQLGHAYATR